jgi:hypothetical protein
MASVDNSYLIVNDQLEWISSLDESQHLTWLIIDVVEYRKE